jgi:predicted nucleic acid-binding protein
MKILIDTNILLYADNKDSNWSSACNTIIEGSLKNNYIKLFIPQKVLLEYYRVSTSKVKNLPVETVIDNIYFYIENFEILYDNIETTEATLELALETNAKSGKIFDLNILASALSNKIDILYTVNIKDFPKPKNLEVLLPDQFKI